MKKITNLQEAIKGIATQKKYIEKLTTKDGLKLSSFYYNLIINLLKTYKLVIVTKKFAVKKTIHYTVHTEIYVEGNGEYVIFCESKKSNINIIEAAIGNMVLLCKEIELQERTQNFKL